MNTNNIKFGQTPTEFPKEFLTKVGTPIKTKEVVGTVTRLEWAPTVIMSAANRKTYLGIIYVMVNEDGEEVRSEPINSYIECEVEG